MVTQIRRGSTGSWLLVGILALVVVLLVLTFPYMGVSGCPSRAVLTTEGNGCEQYLLPWHGGFRFPYLAWLPWAYFVAILATITASALAVRHALRAS